HSRPASRRAPISRSRGTASRRRVRRGGPNHGPGDHALRTTLPASVIWFYQELARRTRPERMQAYLERFGFGNRDISGGIDTFWPTGALRISADDQVEFLRRFYFGDLGVSDASTRTVKEL